MASCELSHRNAGSKQPQMVRWLIDTRGLWPGENILTADGAADAMSLVSVSEQNIVTGMRRVTDARMSLASALLKRAFVSKTIGMPWHDIRIERRGDKRHGKPCAVDSHGRPISGIDFNISHSGGLVALIGYCSRSHLLSEPTRSEKQISIETLPGDILVGIDVVCVNEQDHFQSIDAEGFESWIDMFEDVFSTAELWSMKYEIDRLSVEDGSILTVDDIGGLERCIDCNKHISVCARDGRQMDFNSRRIIESKLRRFHAYFCYKEAYVKFSGEALLAPWLKQLRFSGVRSPKPAKESWGEEIDDVQVHLRGLPVTNVSMKIYAYEGDFMIATAVQGDAEHVDLSGFTLLNLENDVLTFARP